VAYLRRLSEVKPLIRFPAFVFNYLPPAGSSIFHPHMQVLVRDRPFYLVKLLLEKAGSSMENVVKVTVYLTNPKDSGAMNEVYREFFPREPPARSLARIGLEPQGLLVAVDVIAVQKK
jgi:hypothetical protein